MAVGHPELWQHFIHRAGESPGSVGAELGERRSFAAQCRLRRLTALLQRALVEAAGLGKIQLGA